MSKALDEGLLPSAAENSATGDPEIEPLSKQPFDPENPDCLAYHLPDDLSNFAEWPAMAMEELERVVDYVKGLGEMDKTGEEDIDFGACAQSPELIGELICGYFTGGVCCYIVAARTLTHFNGNKCEPTCMTFCVPFSVPLSCCCGPCYGAMKLGQARKQYNLKGTNQFDCLMHYPLCCLGCLAWGDIITRQRIYPPLAKDGLLVAPSDNPAAPLINPAAAEAESAPPPQTIERVG